MRPSFQVVSHELPQEHIVADAVEAHNGWLLLSDDTDDQRWSVLVADIVAWHYLVGDGRLTIHTAARSYLVTGDGHDDPFEVTNELDSVLYRTLIQQGDD